VFDVGYVVRKKEASLTLLDEDFCVWLFGSVIHQSQPFTQLNNYTNYAHPLHRFHRNAKWEWNAHQSVNPSSIQ
jgi:hypothetical protein